jgi:hypothetical protein
MKRYWQIAAGSVGRDYTNDFLRYGMAFVGGIVQCETMASVEIGDVVLLKRGRSELVAAGRVVSREGLHQGDGDKGWLQDFDGWNLKAWCYVDWCVPKKPVAVQGFTRNTIQQVRLPELISAGDRLISGKVSKFQPEPPPSRSISDEEMVEFLISKGLRIADAEDLTATLRRIRRLANYYYQHEAGWEQVREHETRTFLIVPLLLALGWPEQSIKIEQPVPGGRVDLALFNNPFDGDPAKAVSLIETKGFTQGLSYAPGQAKSYAESFPNCDVIFVSNGYCYKAYERGKKGFSEVPSAYLNIRAPSDRYPIDPSVPGALRVLELLLRR